MFDPLKLLDRLDRELARVRALDLGPLTSAAQRLDLAPLVGAGRLLLDPGRIRLLSPQAAALLARDRLRQGARREGPHTLLHLHARNAPEQPALVDGDLRLSYGQLDERVNRAAHVLARLGVSPRDRVAFFLQNGHAHIEMNAACGVVGAVAVQVGYRLKAREVAYLLRDSGAKVLLFDAAFAETVAEARALLGEAVARVLLLRRCVSTVAPVAGHPFYEELLAAAPADGPPRVAGEGGGGLMIYTSGTTGNAKGATRSFQDMGYGPILNFLAELPARHDERHLVVCPLYHSAGAFFTQLTFGIGGCVVLRAFEPADVLATMERERITSTMMVPTMYARLLGAGPEAIAARDLSSLRWMMSAAAPLPGELAGRIEAAFGEKLYNFYAATETGVVTVALPGEHTARPGTIGRVVRGTEVRLLDGEGRPVPDGEVGELYVKNAMLIDGYHDNHDATRAAQREGYFSVGDLARRDADGYYYLADRKTDMVISGGVNIYPWEIEQRLHHHPSVEDAAVVGYPDPEWGEALAAFVVLAPGATLSLAEAQAFVCAELADYKKPRRLVVVDGLPRNATGKLQKRELRQRLVPPLVPIV